MNISNRGKLLALIVSVVILNIVVLSPGLMGLEIGGGSQLKTAAGITFHIVSLIVVLYWSYQLLFSQPAPVRVELKHLDTKEDYEQALQKFGQVEVLRRDSLHAIEQMTRMDKKKETLLQVLGQRFDESELSYKKFHSVIHEIEKLFYLNVRGILNKLNVFDANEFAMFTSQQKSRQFSQKLVEGKLALYKEYLRHIRGYLDTNEEMFLKLDQLLLEISLLGSADYEDIDEMPCMKEIDALIKHTKLYK